MKQEKKKTFFNRNHINLFKGMQHRYQYSVLVLFEKEEVGFGLSQFHFVHHLF